MHRARHAVGVLEMFSKQTIVFRLQPCPRQTVLIFHTESSRPLLAQVAWNPSFLTENPAVSKPLVNPRIFRGSGGNIRCQGF